MNSREEDIKDVYESISGSADCVDKDNIQWSHVHSVLSRLPKEAKILDIACGNGKYMRAVQDLGFQNIYGVDLRTRPDVNEKNYFSCSFNEVPFNDSSLDFCYCISAIYYSEDPDRTLEEWNRVLKPGGYLVFSGHTRYSIYTFIRIIKRKLRIGQYEHLDHITFYDPRLHVAFMESKGYRVISRNGFFKSWIDRFVAGKFSSLLNYVVPARVKFHIGYHYVVKMQKPED